MMPPLPRGLCSYCNTDVPLRKDNLAREHKDPRHPLHKIGQVDRVPVCPGSGKLAATSENIEQSEPIYADKQNVPCSNCATKASRPIPDSTEPEKGDPFFGAHRNANVAPSTPDTGGVEGPYKVEDGNTVTGPTIHGLHMSTDAQGVVDSLNAAWRLGHKAGASGSGDGVLVDAAKLELLRQLPERGDNLLPSETAWLEATGLGTPDGSHPDGHEDIDVWVTTEGGDCVLRLATQNPASGSDGLSAAEWRPIKTAPTDGTHVEVCEAGEPMIYAARYLGGDWCSLIDGVLIEQPRITGDIKLTHWRPIVVPPAAAVSDGGMGDE